MAEPADREDRTEEPTQRRLDDARRRGELPVARDVHHAAFFAAAAAIAVTAPHWAGAELVPVLRALLARSAASLPGPDALAGRLGEVGRALASALAWPVLAVLGAVVASALLQGGIAWSTEALAPKAERLSPLAGAKRLFGVTALVEFGKTLLKVVLAGAAVVVALRPRWPVVEQAAAMPLPATLVTLGELLVRALAAVAAVLAVLAVLDTIHRRFAYRRRLMMTRQEVKDDLRQTEGDPIVKQRLRALRMQRARRRMMAQVPKATVVVTNPTHYAVALRYEPSMAAPVVVAKGTDRVALRIREVARAHGVPVMENPPLARALHRQVELDAAIPPELYKAVAELIAIVMRMGRRPAGG